MDNDKKEGRQPTFRRSRVSLILLISLSSLYIAMMMGFLSWYSARVSIEEVTRRLMTKSVGESAKVVESRLDAIFSYLEGVVRLPLIQSADVPLKTKLEWLSQERLNHHFNSYGIGDLDCNVVTVDNSRFNLKDRGYYQAALQGRRQVTPPLISRDDGTFIVNYAVPILDASGKVTGVLIGARDGNELSLLTNDIQLAKQGTAYVLDKQGTAIAHPDYNLLKTEYNVIHESQRDPSLARLARIHQDMIQGHEGFSDYIFQGVDKYVAYAPIQSTGWSLAVTVPKSAVMTPLMDFIIKLLLVGGGMVAIVVVLVILLTRPEHKNAA